LKENANITLVTTISQINKLPFSFYIKAPRYARQMIWYATNWHPINRKGFKESGNFLNSDLNEFLDLNLVWDQFEVQALQKNGIQNAKAFGSMLFYPKIDHVVHPIVFTITFFDVTPYKQSDNFYTEEMSIDNLLGLVRIKKELELLSAKEIKLQVKPKKSYSSLHSDKYIETLDMLSKSGDLELLSEVSNLYEVVNSSSLILGTPFTSPVLIASELGVPAAFICLAPGDFILTDRELPMSIILDANGLIEKIKNSGY
jgi:polysaccharide biosynthesis PFTS motif protein